MGPRRYAWADVVASAVTTGRVPPIVRATRLVPVGRQVGLRSRVPFLDAVVLDTGQDPVIALVARRRRAKAEGDATLAALLHAAVNALVSGQPARLDDGWRQVGGTWTKVETNSPWTFPPLASTATAGARLLLAVLDRLVRDLGGVVAYRDTDSSIIPASPEGGTLALADGSLVRELSSAEVNDLRRAFDPLSPEPGAWPVWKVTPESDKAPMRSLVFGPKRHVEYRGTDDAPELVDWTETTLGGKWADPAAMQGRCPEGGRAWSRAAVEREVRYAAARLATPAKALRGPAAWDLAGTGRFPTLRRLAVTSPALASTLPDALGPIRPGTRYVEAVPGDAGTRVETVHAVALDPGGALGDWRSLRWVDRHTGAPVRVTTDPMDVGAVLVESLATRAGAYAHAPRGEPISSVLVTPLSVVHRGRVSPVLDAADDGLPSPLVAERVRYEDAQGRGPGQHKALVALAAAMPVRRFAELVGVTPRVARDLARGELPGPSTTRRILAELRRKGAAWLVPDNRTCALDGCGRPLDGRRTYCCTNHAERGRKRRQRQGVPA